MAFSAVGWDHFQVHGSRFFFIVGIFNLPFISTFTADLSQVRFFHLPFPYFHCFFLYVGSSLHIVSNHLKTLRFEETERSGESDAVLTPTPIRILNFELGDPVVFLKTV